MTCKDCLYFERCVVLGVELDIKHNKEADKNCRHFKNKSDYVEVKHGYWKEYYTCGAYRYDCSNCNEGFVMKERCKTLPEYCSDCGAKMDGGIHNG